MHAETKKDILITGGNGFVGQRLYRALVNFGYSVRIFDYPNDITMSQNLGDNVGYVFHLAGKTFVPESWKDPVSFYRVNTLGTINVLEYCRKKGIGLTYMNTYPYGVPASLPIDEQASLNPDSPYNHSKVLAEEAIRYYCRAFKMNAVSLRAFNIFGAGQNKIFLLPSVIAQALDPSTNEIHVKVLESKRDYVYIDDVVNALVSTLKASEGFHAYNVGSGKSYSVAEVIAAVQKAAGTNKRVVADGQIRPTDVPDVRANIDLIRKELGWNPGIDFETGIRKTVEEVKQHG